jgi:hypothetical protein
MPREGIGRFAGASEYSDVEFLEIFKGLLPYVKSGKIDLGKVKDIDVVEKMDSAFCHFGINDHGVFFIETSNSGEVTVDNYRQKFSNEYFFGDFKASFESLLQNAILQNALKKIHAKFGPIRYDAEIFPVLTHTGDESGYITFVATRYDRNKFGKNGAFVVFKSWTKDENAIWKRPDPKTNVKLIAAVETADSADWRIYTNEKHAKLSGNIEFNIGNLDEMLSTEKGIDEAITVLKSRANTTMKAHLKNAIRDVKDKMQGVVDAYAEKTSSIFSKTGDKSPIEGVVLRLKQANGDIFEVKGTSKAFDELKKQTWATRMDLGDLEAVTDGRFLKDALGLNTAQPAALNNAIKKLAQSFTTDEKDAEKKELQFIFKLYESLKDNNAISSPEETKKKVNDVFESAKAELTKIVDAFKANEKNMDPDTRRKSMKAIEMVINKFQKIEGAINAEIPLDAFPLYILKFFLDRRLNTYAATHMNKPATDFSKYYEGQTPVILWNGRAQPWHRGHDAMIQLAKDRLKDVGAAKVLIFIVKGDASSKNKDENPLNEAEQKQLIEAIYKNDSLVAVAPVPLPTSTSTAIWARIEPLKMYVAGWLAGEDRLQDYKKDIDRFNANMWVQDHATLPLKVNDKGTSAVEFIQTPRVMSGTEARSSAKTADFKTWVSNVCPAHALKDKEVIAMYNDIYKKLNANKMESVHEMVLSKFTRVIVEADPVTTPPTTPPATPPAPPTTPPAPDEEPTKVFSNEVIALADTIDKDRKLTVEDLDNIIKKLESEKEPEMPIKPGTAGDAVDTDKKKQEATKKLEDKLKSITVSGVDNGTAEQMKKIVLQQVQKGQKPDLKSVQDGITAENNKFDHTDQTNKAIEEILKQAQAELAPASALGAEFNSRKYDTILRKSFNENMNGVINELEASDIEKQKVIQSVMDMIKKDPANKTNVIEALKYLKSEAKKKTAEPSPEAPPVEDPAKPEATEAEDKKPSHYASALGDPAALESITKWAGRAANLVTWVVSKENDKAGALLSSIGGKVSATIQSLIDRMKKGEADAKELNAQLKSICKMMRDQEQKMKKTYAKIQEKAVGKDMKKLIDDARKTRDTESFLDALKNRNFENELKKSLKPKKIDTNFINALKKAIPNFDTLLQAATKNSDAASEKKIVDGIKKFLTSPAGAAKYPYLKSLYSGDQDDAIQSALTEISSNIGTILHFTPQEFATFKAAQSDGELDAYFTSEQSVNESLDRFAELILSIKKKIDIKDLQAKTGLSKDTINNWIEYEKKTSGNQKVINAIGNQQAQ